MKPINLRQILNAVAIVATIVVNFLANFLPLNGQTTGEVSDRFAVYFTPAGYVFSIWGLIYLALLGFAVYQLLPAQRDNVYVERIGYLFVFSCLANIVWLFFWHYELFPLSVIAMLALLLSLIGIYLRIDIGRPGAPNDVKWAVQIPFSIYLGWITVATIANITILLTYWNWNGWGISPEVWMVIMLAAGLVIAYWAAYPRRDIAYAAVIAWAYLGIAVKPASALVQVSGWAAFVLAILLVVGIVLRKKSSLAAK
jgi:hypothetical protein